MAQDKKLTDCYWFLQNQCKKDKACEYRHFEGALSNTAICKLWVEGKCSNLRCPLRHPSGVQSFCHFFMRGECAKGDDCPFVHVQTEDPSKFSGKKSPQESKGDSSRVKPKGLAQSAKSLLSEALKGTEKKEIPSKQTKVQTNIQEKQTKGKGKQTKLQTKLQAKQSKAPAKQVKSPQVKATQSSANPPNKQSGNIPSPYLEEIRKKNEKKFGTAGGRVTAAPAKVTAAPAKFAAASTKVTAVPAKPPTKVSAGSNSNDGSPKRKAPESESLPAKRAKGSTVETSSTATSTATSTAPVESPQPKKKKVLQRPPLTAAPAAPSPKVTSPAAPKKEDSTLDDFDRELQELGVDLDEGDHIDIDIDGEDFENAVSELDELMNEP